ncbi:MAG: hypothetical protein AB1629_08335 [Candidatus Omnitrophota bacterium]
MPPLKKSNSIRIDFRSLSDCYNALPEGIYHVEIAYAHVKYNKKHSGQYINWHLNVINNNDYPRAKLFLITPLKPTALWKLKKLLKILRSSSTTDIVNINLDDFVGKKLQVKVIQEYYSGTVYNKIIDFYPL